jgi:hypothetical protein
MRFLLSVVLLASATAAGAEKAPLSKPDCPEVASQLAQVNRWQSDPRKPRKLGELPPADTFAAVYRLDERGCMVPAMYREVRGRRR